MRLLGLRKAGVTVDLPARLLELYEETERDGLDMLYSQFFTTMERFMDPPRMTEVRAAVARMRQVQYRGEEL